MAAFDAAPWLGDGATCAKDSMPMTNETLTTSAPSANPMSKPSLPEPLTCQMWIGQGEECGNPAVYRVRRGQNHKFGALLCDEHCRYYKSRPDTYVVIALESANAKDQTP